MSDYAKIPTSSFFGDNLSDLPADLPGLLDQLDQELAVPRREQRPIDDDQIDRVDALCEKAKEIVIEKGVSNTPQDLRNRLHDHITWLETPLPRSTKTAEELGLKSRPVEGYVQRCAAAAKHGTATGTGLSFKNQATGETIQALRHGESIASAMGGYGYQDAPQCSIGETVVGMATGRMSEPAKLSVIGNSGTTGGFLLNPEMSSQVIDLARAASVCMKAGAQTIPMQTSELILAKVDTDPSAYWRPESASITASEPAFGKITLKAKTLACLIPCSIELLEDSSNAAEVITGAVQKSMASELDRVILNGSGAESEPTGICNSTGINTTTSVGVPGDYVEPTAAVSDILGSNYPHDISELAWLQHPTIAAIYDALSDNTSANRRDPTPWASSMKRMYSTNLPNLEGAGSDEYSDVYGYFPSVLVGLRTSGVVVEVLPAGSGTDASSKSVNAVSDMLRWIRAYVRVDVAVTQPSWFNVASGITTS